MVRACWALVEKLAQPLGDDFLNHRAHLGRHQLFLGLRGELGLGHLHRKDASEALAHVVARSLNLGLFAISFSSMYLFRTRVIAAQARKVSTAILLWDIVGEAQHRLLVGIVPLHRDLDGDAVLLAVAEEHVGMQHALGAVHVLDEPLHAAREREVLLLAGALVDKHDLDTVIEERQLAQPPREDVVVVVDVTECFLRSEEMHFRAAPLGAAGDLEGRHRDTVTELHLVNLALAPDGEAQRL